MKEWRIILKLPYVINSSQDSSVSIVIVYGLGGQASVPGKGKICLFSTASRLSHPASYPVRTRGSFLGGKKLHYMKLTIHNLVSRLGMVELYLHSAYIFMTGCLIKCRDNFTLPYKKYWE
jgi:hypothetical protein